MAAKHNKLFRVISITRNLLQGIFYLNTSDIAVLCDSCVILFKKEKII